MTADEALAVAWKRHPVMLRARELVGSSHGERVQSGLWPRPRLGASYTDEYGDKEKLGVSLAQKFELGGKRGARVAAAAAEVFLSETELLEDWSRVRADVKSSFARLAFAREAHRLRTELAAHDRRGEDLAESLYKAGKIPEEQSLRAAERAAASKAEAGRSAARLSDAGRRALLAVGLPAGGVRPQLVASLDVESPMADRFPALAAASRQTNPALAAARRRAAVAHARYRLARTAAWFDLTASVAYEDVSAEDAEDGETFRLGLSVDLPLWDRAQGSRDAALGRLRAAEHGERVAALEVAAALSELFAAREGWRKEEEALRERILPSAGKRLALARDREANGKLSALELLEVEREVTALRLKHLRLRLLLATAEIGLERIAGAGPPGVGPR
ncbi:MAG: TolC family protein [Planctomycetota bacterium]|jgi:cobalt-zinc-cadmium efflux system outer membrane protein